jgi:serine protease AprX
VKVPETVPCPSCGRATEESVLAEAHWYPYWEREDGACPACVQEHLLTTLLAMGDEALHREIQARWPLDAEAAFGALPTPLRLHADPRFTGRGVTIAILDSGFHPHPDLVRPRNRIRAYVDATRDPPSASFFPPDEAPRWPGCDSRLPSLWHGTMTSVVCAGNGFLSHGLYRGLASHSDLVLVRVRPDEGPIGNDILCRALAWVGAHARDLGVRVVTLSVAGEPVEPLADNPVDRAVAALVEQGVSVVAAAGNDGRRRLVPPATSPLALTVGGLDDRNTLAHDEIALWHGNYGEASNSVPKPELVAPSIWVAAPVLPGSDLAREAIELFERRVSGDPAIDRRIAALRLITPHYQHVEGTSFAAPVVAAGIACLLEANPTLSPLLIRDVLMRTAQPVAGAPPERQGAGALEAGRAVALALHERHGDGLPWPFSPRLSSAGVVFGLHDHGARRVEVLGSWDGWRAPGWSASRREAGVWETTPRRLDPGEYSYKFLLDGDRWLDDPANAAKAHDGSGNLNSVLVVPGDQVGP